jgi:hypothetical protein
MIGIMLSDDKDVVISIKRNSNGLIIQGLMLGDITNQNQELIVIAEKGDFKEIPKKGVAISNYLDDEVPDSLLRAVRTELSLEGMNVKKVGLNSHNELVIDAEYK